MMNCREEQMMVLIERHAGMRFPSNDLLPPNGSATLRELARMVAILIEISGRNFRQITILTGALAGLKSAPNPLGHRTYRVIGRTDLTNGEPPKRHARWTKYG
jgi:hypothetical protein